MDQFYKVLNFEVTLNDSTAHLRDAWFGGQGVKHYWDRIHIKIICQLIYTKLNVENKTDEHVEFFQ